MSRKFEIPLFYRSPIISVIKAARKKQDRYKKDLSPSILDLGAVRFKLGRHFGFCFGVENAIDIAYRAIRENPKKNIYLLSEMIHNPHVNGDLKKRGVRFIQDPSGKRQIDLGQLGNGDVVIIPAFGTTRKMLRDLEKRNVDLRVYNTTCPFVEKVWNRSAQIGNQGYTVIIHGRHKHEETRATFSHAEEAAPCLVVRDMEEARILAEFIRGSRPIEEFDVHFRDLYSPGFDPASSLQKIGVVNQTTMLATETRKIAELLREAVTEKYGPDAFADTKDTLCYATSENQNATLELMESGGDLAIVVGGYNSSNTSHLVELLERRLPVYYIKDSNEILSSNRIRHLNIHTKQIEETSNWLPSDRPRADRSVDGGKPTVEGNAPLQILVTSGASCPDALVDEVILKIAGILGIEARLEEALLPFREILQEGPGKQLATTA